MKTPLHFAHGNGFPSPCYHQLLMRLEDEFLVSSIDKIGHDPLFPVTDNWHFLVDELIESVKKSSQEPVIGLGHSLGGVLTLLAAIKEPLLFRYVIMLDSPLIGFIKSGIIRLAKLTGFIDQITPALRTRGRRTTWKSKAEVIAYLRARPLFKTFTQECLEDYIQYGLELDEEGYHLRFNSQIEYEIYRTIPHSLSQYRGRLKCPAMLVYGHESTVVSLYDRRYMRRNFGIEDTMIQGTHMFPMESPEEAANLIKQFIHRSVP